MRRFGQKIDLIAMILEIRRKDVSYFEESDANAKLIAAAPEMLALLGELQKYYVIQGELRSRLDAVIAKAEGRHE